MSLGIFSGTVPGSCNFPNWSTLDPSPSLVTKEIVCVQMLGLGSTGSLSFPMTYDYSNDYGQTSGSGKVRGWSRCERLLCGFLVLLVLAAGGLIAAVVILALEIRSASPTEFLLSGQPVRKLCDTGPCVQAAGEILAGLGHGVEPCQDFYEFACGGWVRRNPVPVPEARWGQFEKLRDRMGSQVREILEEVDENGTEPLPASFELAQDFYDACVEQDDLNLDNSELTELLETLVGSSDTFSLLNFTNILGDLRSKLDGNYLFSMSVEPDERNTSNYVIYLDQPSFTIGQQYLAEASESNAKQSYAILTQTVWAFLFPEDGSRAGKIAGEILRIETALAGISATEEERRNTSSTYHRLTFGELEELTQAESFINWTAYFRAAFQDVSYQANASILLLNASGEADQSPFDNEHFVYENLEYNDSIVLDFTNMSYVVRDPNYFRRLGPVLDLAYNQRDVLNFLKWRIIFDYGGEVNGNLRRLFFDYAKFTRGLVLPAPRWKDCAERTNALFGMAVSYRYVQKFFPGKGIEEARGLVRDLRTTFGKVLRELDWLDPETRALAIGKAQKIREFIGYPDWLEDPLHLAEYYNGLEAFSSPQSHFQNFLQAAHWHYRRSLAKILEPRDEEEWNNSPTIVNAFYSFTENSINFPAGILQPPFFNMPIQALNYGAIGVIIGHEITHGFDDQGHQRDGDGNLVNWWRKRTRENYLRRADCFVAQYSNYSLEADGEVLHIDGRRTLGENIADNGGLRQAFEAYQLFLSRNGPEPSLPGLSQYSPQQLFYIAYAQIWCESYTERGLRDQIRQGPHSPNSVRIRGAVANSAEFARTWSCPPPVPQETCRIWS